MQLIDDEISINNEIKTESECLKSLLFIKNQQINSNNNLNFNPLIVQQNLQINPPLINMNQAIQNNFNSIPNNQWIINVVFVHSSGDRVIIQIAFF